MSVECCTIIFFVLKYELERCRIKFYNYHFEKRSEKMKEIAIKPEKTNNGIIVQYTDNFILAKGMKISVPNLYIAVVFDNKK